MLRLFLCFVLAVLPSFALAADTLEQSSQVTSTVIVPESQQQMLLSFAPIVRKAAPAVVNIFAARVVSSRVSPFMNDPFFEFMFGQQGQGAQRNRMEQALGSGVIVSANGVIVTNRHVVQDAREIKVILNDRREFPAEVVLVDEKTDLAVLQVKGATNLPTLQLGNSDMLEVGDLVLAIGNPFGVGQSVTSGIISATARAAQGITDYSYYIQTDAAINPGNSGGALVDMQGKLIGINTAIFTRSGGSQGIGFAIPVSMVRTVIDAGASGQRIVRPWLGVRGQGVTADIAASLGLERPQGVLIEKLQPASPLHEAGLRMGDIITAVAGQEVDTLDELTFRVGTLRVGSEVEFAVLRKGTAQNIKVTLMAAPETPARDETVMKGENPFAGATVANISPAVLDQLGVESPVEAGVMITNVAPRTTAARLGFKEGDVPLQVNSQPIGTVADLRAALKGTPRLWRLQLRRGQQVINTVIGN